MSTDITTLQDLDYRHLWHPYTDAATYEKQPFWCIERGEGAWLYDSDGREMLDGIASWWCVALGHGHPGVVNAIREQAGVLQHAILGGLAHEKAIQLAARLAGIAPGSLNRSYFAADGSSATEAALKMAVQYWGYKGQPQRKRFVSLQHAYHGDTLGAISAGYTPWFHEPFGDLVKPPLMARSPHAPTSDPEASLKHAHQAFLEMEALIDEHADTVAAVIVEPLLQGAAGIWIYPDEYLQSLRALCDDYGLLLIADEIAVGRGRTGAMYACERAGIVPDFLCLGKCITAGYLPLSVAMATDEVYEAFRSDDGSSRVFWDGHTFCGNPITCAAALAAMDAYEERNLPAACAPLEQTLAERFATFDAKSGVAYQKTLGMVGMLAFDDATGGPDRASRAAIAARDEGLFIRPLGRSLYLWPPLTTTTEELMMMLDRFEAAVEKSGK